jgi:ABC-type sugar transport system ATPase subunit
VTADPPVTFTNVEKQYGGLRPLRVRDLRIRAGQLTMLVGFDRPTAEVLINLMTGATLPDTGEIVSLGRPTSAIATGDEWLGFVEHFGITSERIVLLEGMTVEQNLAISYDLNLEPVPQAIASRVAEVASEVEIDAAALQTRVADAPALLRSKIHLARALALNPDVLVLEHPSAQLSLEDATKYAAIVKSVSARRALTTIGLLMDEKFAKATGGRLLFWQPATGEVRERSGLRFWTYFATFTVIV